MSHIARTIQTTHIDSRDDSRFYVTREIIRDSHSENRYSDNTNNVFLTQRHGRKTWVLETREHGNWPKTWSTHRSLERGLDAMEQRIRDYHNHVPDEKLRSIKISLTREQIGLINDTYMLRFLPPEHQRSRDIENIKARAFADLKYQDRSFDESTALVLRASQIADDMIEAVFRKVARALEIVE